MIQIKILKQRWFIRILFALTVIPLLILNIRKDQDWGDDNSQYIHQAKNIVEGIPQFETGYIYNNHYPVLGPSAYTIGFPLILSPIYAIFGNNILAFNYYLSFLLCLIVLLFILWTKKNLAPWKSLLLILLFVYNPWLLRFKSEINSEIPFTLILLWVFYLFEKQKNSSSIALLLSITMGLLMSIRPIGFVVPLSLFILMVYKSFYKKEATKKQLLHLGLFTPMLSFFIFFLLNYLIFPLDSGVHLENQIRNQLFSLIFQWLTNI